MTYHQLTEPERYMISQLRKTGHGVCATARILERHRSTIDRECKRNATQGEGQFWDSAANNSTQSATVDSP